ncbi:uncharacterized protein LOC130666793 isoform X1 [Microplitis mediator]|uniref:uncharacterized protein LOC130666793 isoform X1 n=1 Tax=Microplitis mediator TaxID=375433 RepID=UPI00255466F8|nr:uncharacterized protein LOC130666793 isoform X1 [Microplitis mediator]
MSDDVKEYAVVEFEEWINDKKAVEVVPIGWLTEDETVCYWPPKNQEENVQKWIEMKYAPGKTWIKYPVNVISKARINNYNDLAKYLQRVIRTEMYSVKKNLNYHIGQKFQKVLEVVQYSADPPGKHQAWKNIGEDLPFDDVEKFITFDESLKNNEEKKKALIDIFQMVSAGCNKCEDDVYKIMWKIIKKEVQLQYSGAGKLIKSLRKKSFKETETFNALERFLTAKYHASKEKPKVLTAVSTFLSGTKDRDGGRSQRNKNIQISEELNDDK